MVDAMFTCVPPAVELSAEPEAVLILGGRVVDDAATDKLAGLETFGIANVLSAVDDCVTAFVATALKVGVVCARRVGQERIASRTRAHAMPSPAVAIGLSGNFTFSSH